ncbi:MAG: SAM-dependent methyltransferase, partial [Anaerolineae bacterium]
RILLEDNERVILIRADLAEPETILNHQDVVRLLDFGRPIALTINAVLHYLVDTEQAQAAVRALVDALEPGSYVAISHMSYEGGSEEMLERADQLFQAAANTTVRSREEIHRFFDGLELVEPGLVRGPLWRPEGPDDVLIDHPNHYLGFVGVGRKF